MDIDEVDAFYAEAKRLQGPPPSWSASAFSVSMLEAVSPMAQLIVDLSGQLGLQS
jgi:hypothetical protein